jgi:crotonobetainyl-CoA:carnitine CoA-transferase CaiB-like acyl-CoA transferase
LLNRNKKSITTDLKTDEGKEIIYSLIKTVDVFIESFRPGVSEKLGISYKQLREYNSKIIYCSISGYGQDGPYKNYPVHDINCVGISGILSLKGDSELPPTRPGIPLADLSSSMFAAVSIIAALYGRSYSGNGCYIDTSITDSTVALASCRMGDFLINGLPVDEMKYLSPSNRVFSAKDKKQLTLGIIEDHFWIKFCDVIEKPMWKDDMRFNSHQSRVQNIRSLEEELKQIFISRERHEWLDIFHNNGIPCGPVYKPHEIYNDPQIKHRKLFCDLEDQRSGKSRYISFPVKITEYENGKVAPPPTLGQNSTEILTELGYNNDKIYSLKFRNII